MKLFSSSKNKSKVGGFLFICWLAYTVTYIGRLNYAASIVEIIDSLSITRAEAGLVSSSFFFAYGIGQFVNGMLCQKYNSRVMIFVALAVSSAINLTMGLLPNIVAMTVLWAVNGFAQSIMWSSLIKMLSEYMPKKLLPRSIVVMSTTVAIGTFIAYGLSSLCVYLGSWRAVFFASAGLVAIAAVIWFIYIGKFEKTAEKIVAEETSDPIHNNGKLNLKIGIVLCFAMIAIMGLANGFLKDGVTTWVPNILYEVFFVEKHYSILLTLLLPLISILGAVICQFMNKFLKSQVLICALMYVVSGFALLLIYFVNGSLALTLIAFMTVATAMAGANNVLTSALPLELRSIASSGKTAGLINTFCCLGSTVATYSLGYLADGSGWDTVILTLSLCGIATGIIGLFGAVLWKKQISNKMLIIKE